MSTINWFIKPTLWGSLTRLSFRSVRVKAVDGVSGWFWRGGSSEDLAWSALNELRDIGETRASAESELLSHPWSAPPGAVGGHAQVDGRPLFAFRTSPLG